MRERAPNRCPRAEECSVLRPGWPDTGTQSSLVYSGAEPTVDARPRRRILNVTGNQCSVSLALNMREFLHLGHDPGSAVKDGLKLTNSDLRQDFKDSVAKVQARYDQGVNIIHSIVMR